MVSFPLAVLYETTADVTTAICFGKNFFSFATGKRFPEHSIAQLELVISS